MASNINSSISSQALPLLTSIHPQLVTNVSTVNLGMSRVIQNRGNTVDIMTLVGGRDVTNLFIESDFPKRKVDFRPLLVKSKLLASLAGPPVLLTAITEHESRLTTAARAHN